MFLFGPKSTLQIPRGVFDEIVSHAKESYPDECCGVLIGGSYKGRRVFESHRVSNINIERSQDRYTIDPKELNLIDKMARVQGMDIVGFYHSHPDHPAKPSDTDREWGQPGYSYIIISVNNGKDIEARCWTFNDPNEAFFEEKIKIE